MDSNTFNPFEVQPTPVDDFVTPNHGASADTSTVEPVKSPTVRERLMGNSSKTRRERLSVVDSPRKTKVEKPLPTYKDGMYVKPIEELYTAIGVFAMPFHPRFGMTMLGPCHEPVEGEPEPDSVATNCAKAWDAAAAQNKTVQRMLESFMTASVLGALIAAHVPIGMALMSGTKLDPARAMEEMLRKRAEQGE